MRLLPSHNRLNVQYQWVDLAGHLTGTWLAVVNAVEKLKGPVPAEAGFSDVDATIMQWRSTDGFYAALGDLGRILRDDPNAFADDDDQTSAATP
jgi:hypothetical protein